MRPPERRPRKRWRQQAPAPAAQAGAWPRRPTGRIVAACRRGLVDGVAVGEAGRLLLSSKALPSFSLVCTLRPPGVGETAPFGEPRSGNAPFRIPPKKWRDAGICFVCLKVTCRFPSVVKWPHKPDQIAAQTHLQEHIASSVATRPPSPSKQDQLAWPRLDSIQPLRAEHGGSSGSGKQRPDAQL